MAFDSNTSAPAFPTSRGFKFPKTVLPLLALAIFLLTFVSSFIAYVGPYEYGIKQVRIGVNRGIQPEVLDPGWVFVVPGMSQMHYFPRGLQVLDLTAQSEERASQWSIKERSAHIQTSDGFFVDVVDIIRKAEVETIALVTEPKELKTARTKR